MAKAFAITDGKGFHLAFSNGWKISVQWGPGNYGDHYSDYGRPKPDRNGFYQSNEAEVAIFKDGKWLTVNGQDVAGYVSADEVGRLIGLLASGQYKPE